MVERHWVEISAGSDMQTWRIPVLRYRGAGSGPAAYLQAALHADEQPGVAVIHALAPLLDGAEREGRLAGAVTLVPYANPIGLHQVVDGRAMGRFHLGSGTNFNRAFEVRRAGQAPSSAPPPTSGEAALKAALVKLAEGADIVLDLHCDQESCLYMYTEASLWPGARDLAARLGVAGVILWSGTEEGGAAFEEAVTAHRLGDLAQRPFISSTVELRGQADVGGSLASADALALYRFLVDRGTVVDPDVPPRPAWSGPALRHDHVINVPSPALGALVHESTLGERVAAGQTIARVLAAPGAPDGAIAVVAPADGLLLIRALGRLARPGSTVATILADGPTDHSAAGRPLSP